LYEQQNKDWLLLTITFLCFIPSAFITKQEKKKAAKKA